MKTHILGIRHHGCGSARSVRKALAEIAPDIVLIEGAPEANDILAVAGHNEIKPPVAILIYSPDEPQRAAFYPFAEFSPEWQAIRFALENKIPVRFIDLPQSFQLSEAPKTLAKNDPSEIDESESKTPKSKIRADPLQFAAEAAGFSDGEIWWENLIESRENPVEIFEAVLELMRALREESEKEIAGLQSDKRSFTENEKAENIREEKREAFMRQEIRRAKKEGFKNAAVICGAWHAPRLADLTNEKNDKSLLENPPKLKLEATWIPYTYGRLTFASGYGAGVRSPEFYHQMWTNPRRITAFWLSRVAQLLREQDLDASSASVIEAVRLAESLAVMRGLAAAGLDELFDAVSAVFCSGDETPLRLIEEKLIVGERMGEVPADVPTVPLQKDLRAIQKRLRFLPDAVQKPVELDLRKPNDLEKSRLLHRLKLLEIDWGRPERAYGKGTFKENWRVEWQPEFEIKIIEANLYGNTVAEAAANFIRQKSEKADRLSALTALVQDVLLAELPAAVEFLMQRLADISAVTSDVPQMMDAFLPLTDVLRYGSVRKTETRSLERITDGLMTRICIGLPNACAAMNDEASEKMFEKIVALNASLGVLKNEQYLRQWQTALEKLGGNERLHSLINARANRILFDENELTGEQIETKLNLAVSTAVEPANAALWIEGFLRGSGLVLLYNEKLLEILNRWILSLKEEVFIQLLPVLRRTFSSFEAPEKRKIGERLKGGAEYSNIISDDDETAFDIERADRVLPLIEKILGI